MMELLSQAQNVGLCYNWLFWGNHASLSKMLDMMSGLSQKEWRFLFAAWSDVHATEGKSRNKILK